MASLVEKQTLAAVQTSCNLGVGLFHSSVVVVGRWAVESWWVKAFICQWELREDANLCIITWLLICPLHFQ